MPIKRPDKDPEAELKIATHIANEQLTISNHAQDRMLEQRVLFNDVMSVLLKGWREPRKDEWQDWGDGWRYAYRGYDLLHSRRIRVAVVIKPKGSVVVTVIDLDKD
jgi:hypothetical protein